MWFLLAFKQNTSGILRAHGSNALGGAEAPLMVKPETNTESHCTSFTVSTDAAGTSTGISAVDRARTLQRLGAANCTTEELRRPGHIFPLITRPGGVLERLGHTEAAVDLYRLADIDPPLALIGELINPDGSMKRLKECVEFAAQHDLKVITVQDLVRYKSE